MENNNKRSELKITISGYSGSGKSTITEFIRRQLHSIGIAADVTDEDMRPSWSSPQFELDRKMSAIKDLVDIKIETKQLRAKWPSEDYMEPKF